MQPKNILAILDPSLEHSRAAHRAMALASQSGARVTLAVFEDHQTIVESGLLGDAMTREAIDTWQAEAGKWLESRRDQLAADGVDIDTRVVIGHPLADKVMEVIREESFDLVIKDSHDGSRLARALFTPLDWHLLRACPVPLMLVRPETRDTPRRVAAAVDPFHERGKPEELDKTIIEAARSLADGFNAELHLVHACQTQPLGAGSPFEGPSLQFDKVREEISAHHTKALNELADGSGIDRSRAHFVDAPARRALPDFTRDQDIDLLVMGTVARKGLTRLIMGSTAEAILSHLECDVLAVKPSDFPVSGG